MDLERLMGRAAPVQRRYGPSLPQVIAPRIDRLPAIARRVGLVVAVLLVAVIVALALRSGNTAVSHAAPFAFRTDYPRSLTREPTPAGALLLLEQHDGSQLVNSYEISPLRLPAYGGEISGLLPVIALNYERRLAAADGPTFLLWSLARTRIINTPAFTFTYQRVIGGTEYFGRVTFITKDLTGDRDGLMLSLLTLPATLNAVTSPVQPTPDAVGIGGPLVAPYQHLHVG